LGGFTSALFTALAIEKVNIIKWPYIMLDMIESERLKSFIDYKNLDHSSDYLLYIRHWKKYLETRFQDGKPIRNKSFTNPLFRIKYYHDNFFKDYEFSQIGGSGPLCMIMAYDALLDCNGKWEKLIVYGMLHSGDSDTIGSIAGGLYGAVYMKGDVPEHMLKYLEKKEELLKISKKLSEKFPL
jgi:ADP-ribosylglycohydrolase